MMAVYTCALRYDITADCIAPFRTGAADGDQEQILRDSALSIGDRTAIAVSHGPGSFTGVRIGVSAVKGMAQPLNKNCFQISTLEAIAKPLENTGCHAVSVMDARCNQVYTAQFDCECGFNRYGCNS